MSEIITSSGLVKEPFDKYWDGNLTRREAQRAFNKLGSNDAELMGMSDTAALVLNYLCERFGVKREEIDEYVKVKSAEVNAMREAMKKAQETQNVSSNG